MTTTWTSADELPLMVMAHADGVVASLAESLRIACEAGIAARGEAHVVVTGGRLGAQVATHLVQADVPWERVHIWFSDERFLPLADRDRNSAVWIDNLFRHVQIARDNVHFIAGSDQLPSPMHAARQYDQMLSSIRGDDDVLFDGAILSVGEDGHVASLFPDRERSATMPLVIAELDAPKPPASRVSLSYSAFSRCSEVTLAAVGTAKRDAAHAVLQIPSDMPAAVGNGWSGAFTQTHGDLPAAAVRGINTRWMLDNAVLGY